MTRAMLANPRSRPNGPPETAALLIACVLAAVATATMLLVRPALAGDQPVSLREALIGSTAQDGRSHVHAPLVARYVSVDGDRFVLDRTGAAALVRFERSDEVWALRGYPAPGGDVLYKNDIGMPVLRATRLGGVTLFTSHSPAGEPAQLIGSATPSRPPHVSPAALPALLQSAILRVAHQAGVAPFKMRIEGEGEPFLFADTLNVTADTLVRMAQLNEGRPYVRRIHEVVIRPGRRPDVRVRGALLEITISPRDGIAGRPSSGRIARAVVEAR